MAEHPGISLIPAIINGVANATGVRVMDIPATPERILKTIKEWLPVKFYRIICSSNEKERAMKNNNKTNGLSRRKVLVTRPALWQLPVF